MEDKESPPEGLGMLSRHDPSQEGLPELTGTLILVVVMQ
jgi:hypothetical protein